jgi:hypothetical protein
MMQFSNYDAFRVALQTLIEGDDSTGDTFNTSTLDLMVGLGEGRVYHGDAQTPALRSSAMVEAMSATVTANAAPLPADLLELKEVYFSGKAPVEVVPLDRLRKLESAGVRTGATTVYCAQDGDTLRFWPSASGTVLGSYYAKPDSIVTVTPWADATTFARYPELFLYACLYESALYLGMDSKAPIWEGRYRALADGANHSERMRVYGGSPLRVRTR